MNINMNYLYAKSDPNFAVSMNENYWWYNEDNKLKSVLCIENGEEKILCVIWDDNGAYIQYNDEKIYVLCYNE